MNNGNTRIYFAYEDDFKKNHWEVKVAEPGLYTRIDFSWLASNKKALVRIKGDLNQTVDSVSFAKTPLKLSVSMNYIAIDALGKTDTIESLVTIKTNAKVDTEPITFDDLEWRRGANGAWVSTKSLTKVVMDKLMVKGAAIYFRIRALDEFVDMTYDGKAIDLNEDRKNGIPGGIRKYNNPDKISFQFNEDTTGSLGNSGRCFSNEVKISIPKKAGPPAITIDGSKFTAPIKSGMEYRVTVGGETSEWVKVTDTKIKARRLVLFLTGRALTGLPKTRHFRQ